MTDDRPSSGSPTGTRDASATDPPSSGSPSPDPPLRLVEGTASIDDLDGFLDAIDRIAADSGAVVQAFDADRVVDADHLRRATRLAARAIARDEAVARDPAVEVLLYAAGRRQIDRALELGVSVGHGAVVVAVADFGGVPGADRPPADLSAAVAAVEGVLTPASTLGEFDERAVREYYGVTDRELASTAGGLAHVVHERVALLDVEK